MGSPAADDSVDGVAVPRALALEYAARHAAGILLVVDHTSARVRFLNSRVQDILGYDTSEVEALELLRSWLEPEDVPSLDALPRLFEIVDVGETIETQLRVRDSRGTARRMRGLHVLLAKDASGAAAQSLLTLEDVTESHRLFESLERKSHELESLLCSLPDAFFRLDETGCVLRCFPGNFRRGQWEPAAAVGRPLEAVLPPRFAAPIREALARVRNTHTGTSLERMLPDHPEASFEARIVPFLDHDVMLLVRDLENRALAERELAQQRALSLHAAKLAALGEMSAGVAHEINTPLAVLCSGAEFLKEALELPDPIDRAALMEEAEIIHTTSFKIAAIVRSLRAFSTDEARMPLAPVPVNVFITDALSLCAQRVENRGVAVISPRVPDSMVAMTRRSEAAQILLNLLSNAFDAVSPLSEHWIRIDVVPAGQSIEISVTDSGPGVPEAARDRLFAPFFTTKPVGKGTGLGLAVSRRLAESQGGSLELDPTSPNTRFVLTLRTP